MRTLTAVLLALAVLFTPGHAAAHVVNLSQSDFTVEGASVRGLLVFAKPDAARLGRMDPDGDGIVTPAELEASQDVFRRLVEQMIDVTGDGARCASTLEGGGDTEGDGFGLSVTFVCARPPRELVISLPVLRELLPAHRHILRLRAGTVSDEAILTPDSPRFARTLSGASNEASPSSHRAFSGALRLGIAHILTGWDHVLFLFALLIGTRGLRPTVLAVSAFTVAHSLTLALASLSFVTPSPRFVEPAIAASIVYVAFENLRARGAPGRWHLTFLFGLVHGFGFAGALHELALARDRLVPTLFGFNLGVEVGQLAVVAAMVPILALTVRGVGGARERATVRVASLLVAAAGIAVFVARVAFPS
jgi:hypothetical protein